MSGKRKHIHLAVRRLERLVLVGVLSALLGLLVAACGSEDPTATPVPQQAAPTATPTPTPVPVPVDFPTKPIEFILGWAAGGGFDLAARTIGQFMGDDLGVDVVVRNHTGSGGRRAVDAVRRGEPDGHTISIMNMPMQLMAEKLDPRGADFTSFAWIGQAVLQDNVVIAPKSATFNTPEELAAAEPRICMPGFAGHNFMVAAVSTEVMGIPWKIVAGYTGGADVRAAMLRGECDVNWTIVNSENIAAVTTDDDFKGLWVYSKERLPWGPDIPSVAEIGYPKLAGSKLLNSGLVAAPGGTPPEIMKILEDSFQKAVRDPDVVAKLKESGQTVAPMSAADTRIAVGEMDVLLGEFRDVVKARKDAQ